ncbi:MAG: hypothetical protein ACKVU0_05865 [Saprospiraceae bacterium]
MKSGSIKILVGLFFLILCNCRMNNVDCPYKTISSITEINTKNLNDVDAFFDLGGQLDTYLKKIGKANIDVDIRAKLDNYSEKIISDKTIYEKNFVENWNSLVIDICGKISLYNQMPLDEPEKKRLEMGILDRVEKFYENAMKTQAHQVHPEVNKNIDNEKELEIPIQLSAKTNGYKEIYINNQKAKISTSSTKYNPRVMITPNSSQNQYILIITNSNDTCNVSMVFDSKSVSKIGGRIIPNCN